MSEPTAVSRELGRIWAAAALLTRQQLERIALGGREEYSDVLEETRDVADDVVAAIERGLDEDLVEALNREEDAMSSEMWPFWAMPRAMMEMPRAMMDMFTPPADTTVTSKRRREEALIDQIVANFRAELLDDLREARRDDRELSAAEIDDRVNDLRDQLDVLVSRSGRRRRSHAEVLSD